MMDGPILNTRLTRGSSSRSRKLESEIAAKQHLLVRLVDAINQHSGRENQYYAQLLRPHMDFMIHEFPVRIEVIAEQEDQEDAQKGEHDILIQRGRELCDILLDALDAMAALQARADPNYTPPVSRWRPPTPPTRRRRPPRSTPKSGSPPPSSPTARDPQLSSTTEESSPPSPPAESSPPLSPTVEDTPPTPPSSEPDDGNHDAGSNLLLLRDPRPKCSAEEPLGEPHTQEAPIHPSPGEWGPWNLAWLLLGAESELHTAEDTTPVEAPRDIKQLTPAEAEDAVVIEETKDATPQVLITDLKEAAPAEDMSEAAHNDARQMTPAEETLVSGTQEEDPLKTFITEIVEEAIGVATGVAKCEEASKIKETKTSKEPRKESKESTPHPKVHELQDTLQEAPMGSLEDSSFLQAPASWAVLEFCHQPEPPDFQQVRQLPPLLRPGEPNHDGSHTALLHSEHEIPAYCPKNRKVSEAVHHLLSPPLLLSALPSVKQVQDLGPDTVWKKRGHYLPGGLEITGRGRSSEYMHNITMFLSSCEDTHAAPYGQFQHHTRNLGTQRTSLRLQFGLPGRLLSDMRRPPSIHLPGGRPLNIRLPRTRIQTGGPSRLSPSAQGVSGSRLILMEHCRITMSGSGSAMMGLISPCVSIWNEIRIISDHDMHQGHQNTVYMLRLYGPKWVQTHMFIAEDQMMRLPVQSVLPGHTRKETRRPPGTTTPGSLPLGGLPPTLTRTTGWSSTSISTQGVSGSLLRRTEQSLSRKTGSSASAMLTVVKLKVVICNEFYSISSHTESGGLHKVNNLRTSWITYNFTMREDKSSTMAAMFTATLITMRIPKTLQAPPWTNLPLHVDIKRTLRGNLPIALTDVKAGNFPIALTDARVGNLHAALTDVGPRTFPQTYTDDTLGTLHSMLPDVGLRRAGQVHYALLHPQVQDLRSYPRGPEERGMKNSFSVSECFSGSISRESRKTT